MAETTQIGSGSAEWPGREAMRPNLVPLPQKDER
jgi:hypothetical protein